MEANTSVYPLVNMNLPTGANNNNNSKLFLKENMTSVPPHFTPLPTAAASAKPSSASGDGDHPPKEHKKVSRACDRCRHKKIRCDLSTDPSGNGCANCVRNNMQCSFTHIPLKRGPSKGNRRRAADKNRKVSQLSAKTKNARVSKPYTEPQQKISLEEVSQEQAQNDGGFPTQSSTTMAPNNMFSGQNTPPNNPPSMSGYPQMNRPVSEPQWPSFPSTTTSATSSVFPSISTDVQQPQPMLTASPVLPTAAVLASQPLMYAPPPIRSSALVDPFRQSSNPPSSLMPLPTSSPGAYQSSMDSTQQRQLNQQLRSLTPRTLAAQPVTDKQVLDDNGFASAQLPLSTLPSPMFKHALLPSINSFDSSAPILSPVPLHSSPLPQPVKSGNPVTDEILKHSLLGSQSEAKNSERRIPNLGGLTSEQNDSLSPLSQRDGSKLKSGTDNNASEKALVSGSETTHLQELANLYKEDVEWDEAAIDRYYLLIHSTFPILHHSKARLRAELENAPVHLRSSCLHAIYSLVNRPPFSSQGHSFHNTPSKAIGMLNLLCTSVQVLSNRILHLQTMILLAIESDQRGPATITGKNGLPQSMWLGAAVGLACNMRLHMQGHLSFKSITEDIDSSEALCRRAWWVLVVLDRWHSMSTCSPLFIPEQLIRLTFQDQKLLGSFPSHLVRLSLIVGHLSSAYQSPTFSARDDPIVAEQIRSEIDAFRESVDVVWGQMNLLTLAVTHVKVLLELAWQAPPASVLKPALKMATILPSSSTPLTPLNHHFFSLAACVLIGVFDVPGLQSEARRGLGYIRECIEKRRDIVSREDHEDWDYIVLKLINAKLSGMPLSPIKRPPHIPHSSVELYDKTDAESTTFGDAYLYTRFCNLGYLGFLI
ncbi:transcription factor [Schizosaccharomyces japonicus yFS275]|uniref:Transcription factor n=1 Tax=Schizosaccharomyces japonicus (strain yFS275 / FY16936) TaxID=402676 RepID=B6JZA3_SCHJY|nr:transcription factor [Schizosaccharomyces japonicus yFS275]EEB06871.1 transcription factor [Schizosaccharomyces japonicus yFS275]